MRILYFTQYFPPEVGATQTRAWEMGRYLIEQGHQVTVVTEVPNHPSGIIPPAYRGRLSGRRSESGIDVLRLWVWTSPNKTFRSRMQFYLSYMSMAALAGSLIKGKYDLVYVTSPPLFVGAAGMVAALVRRIPFVFEVRDLWPESAVALGELSSRRAIAAAERLEQLLYRGATRIVAVTEGIRSRLLQRGIRPEKVALIPNGANTDLFTYQPEAGRIVAERLGLSGKFIALYAGIHGVAQGLETVVRAAHLLRDREDIEFVFVGEGPRKGAIMELSRSLALDNIHFLPEVPSESMPAYLSAAGCAIVPLRDEPLFRGALPSKMFEAWACSRPVVLSVAGEAADVLKQASGGLLARPEDPEELAHAIAYLQARPLDVEAMGQSGRAYVERHYSRREQARKLAVLLEEVLAVGK
ncbi:MAG TPA: glycosyltransferase family 4 protein [Chloroflexia bacterium]|nr:glycosyltransferase family 4 protein [Chloroflexia bacterium]